MKQLTLSALEVSLIRYLPVCSQQYFVLKLLQREVQCYHEKGLVGNGKPARQIRKPAGEKLLCTLIIHQEQTTPLAVNSANVTLFFYFKLSYCFSSGRKIKIFPCETGSVSLFINKLGYECWQWSDWASPAPQLLVKLLGGWRLSPGIWRMSNSLAHFDTGFPLMFFSSEPPCFDFPRKPIQMLLPQLSAHTHSRGS